MTEFVADPVNRVRYRFEPRGDDLVVDVWLDPGGSLPPHLHPRQTERWSVVDGRVRFQLDDDKRIIGPDDGEMTVPPGHVHGLQAVEDHEVQLRCVAEPALQLQAFLEESAAAARDGLFTSKGLPRGLKGARFVAGFLKRHRNDTVFLTPPDAFQRLLIAVLARDTSSKT